MIFDKKNSIGIVSYGSYVPKRKVFGKEIAKSQGKLDQKIYKSLGVESKTVPGIDEDTVTISTAAGFQALERLKIILSYGVTTKDSHKNSFKKDIGALFIGSESHPYAVKATGTVVAQALGIASDSIEDAHGTPVIKPLALADLQFACKAGTQAMQICSLYVNSGFCKYALAIGADTAQAKPGDVLEYTAGAGGGAIILGKESNNGDSKLLAKLIATTSVATDTPDFWRRPSQPYPEHAGRFTAGPGYFNHISMAAEMIMKETGLRPSDFEYCVFHSPNAKFPMRIAKKLGFSEDQLKPSLVVQKIGNTYAAATILGLISTLDIAKKNKKILVVSYGSGSGSDAFVFETTSYLEEVKKIWKR
jgi:hydroxymethylglutaryl-CoA synthase